jgi:heat shock protein HtpX
MSTSGRHGGLFRFTNYAETAMLMAVLTGLTLWAGERLGGVPGLVWAAALVLVLNTSSLLYGDRIALIIHKAKPATRSEQPMLFNAVESLAARAGLPMPRIWIIPNQAPNAFAAGRNPRHASVAVTEGLLKLLDERELRAVIAHELSHVVHRDILIATVAGALAGMISFLARAAFWFRGGWVRSKKGGMAALVVAPVVATLLQLAISRSREYGADEAGADLCGDPEALASALEKVDQSVRKLQEPAVPATSHLFIMNPFLGQSFQTLLSTHPPTTERVARLRSGR